MGWSALREHVALAHEQRYGVAPSVVAFAPGRVEVLGNHTDYNEGLALSAAVEEGICFAISPGEGQRCRAYAVDLDEEAFVDLRSPQLSYDTPWLNYPAGVLQKLQQKGDFDQAFNATFMGDITTGSGMGSSAALAVSAGLAMTSFYGVRLPPMELAKLCREAEEDFAGVRCGLLDQVTSLFGSQNNLIFTDFRSLAIKQVPMPPEVSFLVCHTALQHELINSEYNLRRVQCDEAVAICRQKLDHPVESLRDVTLADLETCSEALGSLLARRATHVVSENQRVVQGIKLMVRGDADLFGSLMFASHESSMMSFENSSPEQDTLVLGARRQDGVLGARLSGAGFGGNVLVLAEADSLDTIRTVLQKASGEGLDVKVIRPAAGAQIISSG